MASKDEEQRWIALGKWIIAVDKELEAIQQTIDEMLGRTKKKKVKRGR